MHRITLHPPDVSPGVVRFSWAVEPATALYRANHFSLRFPPEVDTAAVPYALWWYLGLLCLHSHWTLLRPCAVSLPVKLGSGELEFWMRQLRAEIDALESMTATPNREFGISIEHSGPLLEPIAPARPLAGWATAFSSGKDSLLHAGLIRELTGASGDVLLVHVRATLPGLWDNETPKRREVLGEVATMPGFRLVEVDSDYRESWDNTFALARGYDLGVNEISDTFLYTAATIGAGYALGAGHFGIASEGENSDSVEIDGVTVQHHQFMYSFATVKAVDALLGPFGLHYSSLISALHNSQVGDILWRRYPDLARLQHSCWLAGPDGLPCNRCGKCRSAALCVLTVGQSPEVLGIDTLALLQGLEEARIRMPSDFPSPLRPAHRAQMAYDRQRNRYIQGLSARRLALTLLRRQTVHLLKPTSVRALRTYANVRRGFARLPQEPAGFRPGFLAAADPALQDGLARIFGEHASPEHPAGYAEVLARDEELAQWIIEPLQHPEPPVERASQGR